jgi:hypothetical protein
MAFDVLKSMSCCQQRNPSTFFELYQNTSTFFQLYQNTSTFFQLYSFGRSIGAVRRLMLQTVRRLILQD